MDEVMKKKLDALVEADLVQGYRIVEVPESIAKVLAEAATYSDVPSARKFRIVKLNPKKRAQVAEAVLARYHADRQNPAVLSTKRIREIEIERGTWVPDNDAKIEQLQMSTSRAMQELTLDGFDKERQWQMDIQDSTTVYITAIDASSKVEDEKEFLKAIFWRWVNYTENQKAAYTELYAAVQGSDTYLPDRDLSKLQDTAPSDGAAEALGLIDDTMFNLARYTKLFEERRELVELLTLKARLFSESIEARRDGAEEIARLYYGVQTVDGSGGIPGPITGTLEAFWELPEEFVGWLMEEAYFFYNNIPTAIREHLDDWGFTTLGRENGLVRLSGESPDPQSSKSATIPSEPTAPDSSESADPMI